MRVFLILIVGIFVSFSYLNADTILVYENIFSTNSDEPVVFKDFILKKKQQIILSSLGSVLTFQRSQDIKQALGSVSSVVFESQDSKEKLKIRKEGRFVLIENLKKLDQKIERKKIPSKHFILFPYEEFKDFVFSNEKSYDYSTIIPQVRQVIPFRAKKISVGELDIKGKNYHVVELEVKPKYKSSEMIQRQLYGWMKDRFWFDVKTGLCVKSIHKLSPKGALLSRVFVQKIIKENVTVIKTDKGLSLSYKEKRKPQD